VTTGDQDEATVQRDQVPAQLDRVAENRDQSAEQRSSIDESRAVTTGDQDEAADLRDEAAGLRDQVADLRDQEAGQRDQVSEHRDRVAEHRDQVASQRDEVASQRDEAASQRSRVGVQLEGPESVRDATGHPNRSALVRRDAALAHVQASREGGAAASGRAHAELDRDSALGDRQAAASGRGHAGLDREAAMSDRAAGAGERAHAELDREEALADRAASARAQDHATVDWRTRVDSWDAVLVELEHEIGRAREVGQPLVLAFVDIDHLGAINESHGRGADARLLAKVASTLRAELRSCDLVFRHGNAEFVCVLPGLDTADAAKQFGLVNGALAAAPEHGSVMVGFAELRPDESADDLVARAKDALIQEHRQQPEA
jgi:diguanylate cyclase (GGDEF)-like protein